MGGGLSVADLGEDHLQIVHRIDVVEPAALCDGEHEGGILGCIFTSDVLAVFQVELDGLHPLLAEVVGDFDQS